MKISEYQSTKIKVLSSISILLVLFIHSEYIVCKHYTVYPIVQHIFSESMGLCLPAVSLFFFISGFLFFNNINEISECIPKIRKRFHTIFIPYIIWNTVFILWYVVLSLLPFTSSFVNNFIDSIDWTRPIPTILSLFTEPAGFHLWFLRDLICLCVLSPLLYLGIKRIPRLTLLFLFCSLCWRPRIGCVFFVFGGILSQHYSTDNLKKFVFKKSVLLWLSLIFLANMVLSICRINFIPEPLRFYWVHLISFLGMIIMYFGYDDIIEHIPKRIIRVLILLSPYTFFIYLFHEPTINIIKKALPVIIGESDILYVSYFLLTPFIITCVSYLVGRLTKRIMPKTYNILVGGR